MKSRVVEAPVLSILNFIQPFIIQAISHPEWEGNCERYQQIPTDEERKYSTIELEYHKEVSIIFWKGDIPSSNKWSVAAIVSLIEETSWWLTRLALSLHIFDSESNHCLEKWTWEQKFCRELVLELLWFRLRLMRPRI